MGSISHGPGPGFAQSFVIKNEIIEIEEDSIECETPILIRPRDYNEKKVQYLTPIITKIPDRHQFPILRLIKQEPIDQLTKEKPLNPLPAKKFKAKRKSKNPKIPLENNDNKQDKFEAHVPRDGRILLPNPLFQLRERLNKIASRSTSTGTQETSGSRINISTAAETENISTSTFSDSSMFYIDVANLDRTESEESTTSISTILNIKEELENNLNALQNEPSRRIQPKPELSSNNGGDFICGRCKMAFMYSGQLLSHLKSHLDNRQQQKSNTTDNMQSNHILPNCPESVQQEPLNFNDLNAAKATATTSTKISAPRLEICKELRIIIPKVEIEIKSSSDSELDCLTVSYLETSKKEPRMKSLPIQTHNLRPSSLSGNIPTTSSKAHKGQATCDYCGKTFKHPCLLKVHLVTHTGERPFECQVCHKTFTRLSSLCIHRKRTHLSNELQCKNCGNAFSAKENLERHTSNRTCWKQPFKCGVCNKIFTTRQNMQVHVRRHTGENPYVCCDIIFRTQAALDRHKKLHTSNERKGHSTNHHAKKQNNSSGYSGSFAKLDLSSTAVHSTENLDLITNRNVQAEAAKKPRNSRPCNKSFETIARLYMHEKSIQHSKNPKKRCNTNRNTSNVTVKEEVKSSSRYQTRARVKLELEAFEASMSTSNIKDNKTQDPKVNIIMASVNNIKGKDAKIQCKKAKAASTSNIKNKKVHHRKAKITKTASETSNSPLHDSREKKVLPSLSWNMKTRSNTSESKPKVTQNTNFSDDDDDMPTFTPFLAKNKKFHCSLCNKRYTTKMGLQSHNTRKHTVEKPFKCDFCQKLFSTLGFLVQHQKIHTQPKPLKCKICKKSFPESHALNVHIRKHTGEKPFECDFCGKKFSQKSGVIQHRRIHTGERPYECTICTVAFIQLCHLNQHQKSCHSN